jgi:hypothetical protein
MSDSSGGGVCAHLHACSSEEIKELQARYRKVINWSVREEMDPMTVSVVSVVAMD